MTEVLSFLAGALAAAIVFHVPIATIKADVKALIGKVESLTNKVK